MEKVKQFILKNKKIVLIFIIIIVLLGAFLCFYNFSSKDDDQIIINKEQQKITKEIVVKNDEDKKILYDLEWSGVSNTFRTQSDLLYSITSSDGKVVVTNSQVPVADSPIMFNVSLPKDTTHKYILKMWYKKSENSKDDGSASFTGRIIVRKHVN